MQPPFALIRDDPNLHVILSSKFTQRSAGPVISTGNAS
jgi:hypothetical protein